MTVLGGTKATDVYRNTLIRRLRELIEALERRAPRPERKGEIRIVQEAAALKQKALERLAELET